jgi:hypothetical protein
MEDSPHCDLQLLQKLDPHGHLSSLFSIVSRLYLLNGALVAVFKRESMPRRTSVPGPGPARRAGWWASPLLV